MASLRRSIPSSRESDLYHGFIVDTADSHWDQVRGGLGQTIQFHH